MRVCCAPALRRVLLFAPAMLGACDSKARPAATPSDAARAVAAVARADSIYARVEYDSARDAYDEALREATKSRDEPMRARILTTLGLLAWHQGRFTDARAVGESALALKRRLNLNGDLAKSYNALGLLAQNQGRLEEASILLKQAFDAALAVNDSAYAAKARGNRGLVYSDLGDFDRARAEMLAMRDVAARIGDERTEGNALTNIGMVDIKVGRPSAAITSLVAARSKYAASKFAVGEENALGQLATAYAALGEPARAFAYLDSALAVARRHGLKEPEDDDLKLMAEMYEDAGDHRQALAYLRQARALAESLDMQTKLGDVALAEAHAFDRLGDLALARQRATEAAQRHGRASARFDALTDQLFVAELAQRAGDSVATKSAIGTAASLAERAPSATSRIRLAIGRARIADLARRSLEVIASLDLVGVDSSYFTAGESAEVHALRARAYARVGQLSRAIAEGRGALAELERIRDHLPPGALRASYSSERLAVYGDLVVALLRAGRVDAAFQIADRARGRGLVDQLATTRQDVAVQADGRRAEAERLLRRIDALVERLRVADTSRVPDRAVEATAVGPVARELAEARREYEGLLARSGAPDSGGLHGTTDVDIALTRTALAPAEALVEYLSSPDRLIVFVLTRTNLAWLDVPIGADELADRVRLARELIARRNTGATAPLRELFARLIAPAEDAGLLRGVQRLLIVPHAALAYLPFAALTRSTNGGDEYLVSRYSSLVLPSAAALATLRARGASVGEPQATVLAPFPSELPGTRREAEAVQRALPGARSLVGPSATERNARDALSRAGLVHMASHGAVNTLNRMFSSVRLASAGRDTSGANNGQLEVHELLGLHVRSSLVFLSGCETGLGISWSNSFRRGEDYTTLAQAFLHAGAENVVSTLWRIEDEGAAVFASRFYDGFDATAPVEALAVAQRAMLTNDRYRAPYYWAAYTLSGSGALTAAQKHMAASVP